VRHAFQEWIAPKWLDVDRDNLRMKFLALNIDFSSPQPDPVGSMRRAHVCVKEVSFLKSGYLSAVGLSSVKMIADRHRHAAYHSKHW